MNSQTRKENLELEVFRGFSKHYPEDFDMNTLIKMSEPHPDLQCDLVSGGSVAFELAEIVDQGMARSIYSAASTKRRMDSHYSALPAEQKEQFDRVLQGRLIHVVFQSGTSKLQRERGIPTIFDTLSDLDEVGEEYVPNSPTLMKVVKKIRFGRLEGREPIFDVNSGGSAGDPLQETVEDKLFNKNYVTEHPTELLVYYDLMPTLIGCHARPDAYEWIKINISGSVFRRVWIYSRQDDNVLSAIEQR